MKKSEQIAINQQVLTALETFNNSGFTASEKRKRLDNCTAWIYENDKYYILQSYNTIIAFVDKANNTLYDVLRYVYGYTATSAKHISKFKRYASNVLTYRSV